MTWVIPHRRRCVAFAFLLLMFAKPFSAEATITQGDLSISGNFESRIAGRFGEGSDRNPAQEQQGLPANKTGGPYDFTRWDLVEFRQIANIRPDYRIIKNYKFLDRIDNVFIKDADLFGAYQGWYDAFGDFKNKGIAPPGYDWVPYTSRQKLEKFKRNELREYWDKSM